ncbi:MAG: glutathione S-transferase family protein [Myxococcota bacterium]
MSDVHRIFGAEVSPYSVKVRSYFRYKQIPHEWIVRGAAQMEEFKKYAKLPLIPVVVSPADEGSQDSTPIIEKIEAEHPEPSIHPDDPVAAFVSVLIEEFGDEWGNKWMFHYRWAREADQDSAAERIARTMMPDLAEEPLAGMVAQLKERMVGRVWFVGSSPQTAPQIEESFERAMPCLESHLADRKYLFGDRPAFGDFGLWGQLYNAWTDPTAGAIIKRHPNLAAWIKRMLEPKTEGAFEPWSALAPTLEPFLEQFVGALFLPWSAANAAAIAAGDEEFTVELEGRVYTQKPQKYHARSLAALRARYVALADRAAVDAALEKSGCLPVLRG